jgi:hypothetical protein
MKQIDLTQYVNKENQIDKFKIAKTILHEPIIKYSLYGIGVILLLYGSGKIMKVISGTILEFKHLKSVLNH